MPFPFGDSSTALTGRYGQLKLGTDTVARLTSWTVSEAIATQSEWGDSDSNGYTQRATGRRSATISAEGRFDITSRQSMYMRPGIIYEVWCWLSKDLTQTGGNKNAWHFPRALTISFELVVNVDTEEVLGWTAEFASDGVFYYPGDPADTTLGDPGGIPTVY